MIQYIIVLENGTEVFCVKDDSSIDNVLSAIDSFVFTRQLEEIKGREVNLYEWLDSEERNKYQWKYVTQSFSKEE